MKELVKERDKSDLLEKYLKEDWYNKEYECYEAHKSSQNIYYGYWSFEAGAIAKILNLDDSNLKDMPYYPYDLVHIKDKISVEKMKCGESKRKKNLIFGKTTYVH